MRRVARARIVILTHTFDASAFWLTRDYLPELDTAVRQAMPPLQQVAAELGDCDIAPILIPNDCLDGFLGAYWRRPHAYLDPLVRRSISAFASVDVAQGLQRLASDLETGAWHRRNEDILNVGELDLGYRLLSRELIAP